jgi:hypothetical protein
MRRIDHIGDKTSTMEKLPIAIQMPTDPKKVARSLALAASKVKCGFCSMRADCICNFPNCGRPFCKKHGVSTGTTDLCRDHKNFAELTPEKMAELSGPKP